MARKSIDDFHVNHFRKPDTPADTPAEATIMTSKEVFQQTRRMGLPLDEIVLVDIDKLTIIDAMSGLFNRVTILGNEDMITRINDEIEDRSSLRLLIDELELCFPRFEASVMMISSAVPDIVPLSRKVLEAGSIKLLITVDANPTTPMQILSSQTVPEKYAVPRRTKRQRIQ